MSIGQNIKRLRALHGMNQSELAQIAGVTDKAVSTWENDLKIPRMGAIQKIADYFHISKSAIIEDESQNPLPIYPFPGVLPIRGHRPVPIIGNAACGQPIYKPGDGTDFIDAGPEIACDFALIADGDSMIGDRIHDGDVVFIRQQNDADDGSIVAVAVDDEMMLKHISRVKAPDGTTLYTIFTSSNPKYAPISVGGENETRNVYILGKAVAFRSLL